MSSRGCWLSFQHWAAEHAAWLRVPLSPRPEHDPSVHVWLQPFVSPPPSPSPPPEEEEEAAPEAPAQQQEPARAAR
jgi:hypothetical protein